MKYYNLCCMCLFCFMLCTACTLKNTVKLKAKSQFKVSNNNYGKPKRAKEKNTYICAPKLYE